MASITIRNLDNSLKQRLRVRAAEHGCSMEEEARAILREVVGAGSPPANLATAIRSRVTAIGGMDIDQPCRAPQREPPEFD